MPFNFIKTEISGLFIIEPRVFSDPRGFFCETYKKSDFEKNGINDSFVQDNHSLSEKGVLRGLHFQTAPYAQGKLVCVIKGAVWDVAVDMRKGSPTFMQWSGIELSEENHLMFYLPSGFAHGFLTLRNGTHFVYKCTNEYNPDADGGIRWNDPSINVNWPVNEDKQPIVSGKDAALPLFKDLDL